jgi:DNA polymerase III sliding clamp (beta) subunit (PCNA family)
MQLTKKQVAAFLEVISSDSSRPILTTASVELRENSAYQNEVFLVATDGYVLAALMLPKSFEKHAKKVITRAELIKWYKLASSKDLFTDETLEPLLVESDGNYPDWQKLMPTKSEPVTSVTKISLNAKYMMTMQKLNNEQPVTYDHFKEHLYMGEFNGNMFVIMSLKV